MHRTSTILMAGLLALGLSASCDDETTTGGGGASTPTGSSTGSSTGSEGGAGGVGLTGGTGGTGNTGNTGGSGGVLLNCDGSVADGETCTLGAPSCQTATGCCQCLDIVGCGVIWICADPPGDAACPASAPAFNETCPTEGELCEYCLGGKVQLWRCYGGVWMERMPGCVGPG